MLSMLSFYHVYSLTCFLLCFFFFNDTATTEIYTLSLHDALPISENLFRWTSIFAAISDRECVDRSEEHTSELQSRLHLVCRLLLEKKTKKNTQGTVRHLLQTDVCLRARLRRE